MGNDKERAGELERDEEKPIQRAFFYIERRRCDG
jgi:hypothetical protein